MIRFIGNFIIFGLIFFLIWRFFPDVFNTLVHWATQVVDFLQVQAMKLYEAVQGSGKGPVNPQ